MAKSIFEEHGRQIRKARRLFDTVLNCTRRRRTAGNFFLIGIMGAGGRHLDYLKHTVKLHTPIFLQAAG